MAYGSKVFNQGVDSSRKQIDFIFAVDDIRQFHHINLQQHPQHYSLLKYVPQSIYCINQLGSGIYYNTLCRHEDSLFKYGVIQIDSLVEDLVHWHNFFLAGRFHKPVIHLSLIHI